VASCSAGTLYSFTVSNPQSVYSQSNGGYFWDVDGATSTRRSFSYDYASDNGYEPGVSHVVILILTGPGGTTSKSTVVVAPC
jgi:hypothetical protein